MPLQRLLVACVVTLSGLLLASPHAQQAPEVTVSGMKTDPGLAVTLWAAEPQLSNPTNMAIDERGRVWVAEGVNYRRQLRNQPDIRPAGDRILILEDTDNDGRADKVTIFADHLNIPTSLTFANGGVIVTQTPDILFLKDTDGDGKADVRQVLSTG